MSESAKEEWDRMAAEPATDEEIAMHKRQAVNCRCLPCMDKLRLIARIEADAALRASRIS